MRIIKGLLAFFEVIFYITGIFSADTAINYGGKDYMPMDVSTPMAIVENSVTDFVIVTENKPDKTINTAVKELKNYIKKISGAEIEVITESSYTPNQKAIIL